MGGVCPNASENGQISPTTTVRAARGDGSCPNLASILPEGRKTANIQASSGVIRGIPAHMCTFFYGPIQRARRGAEISNSLKYGRRKQPEIAEQGLTIDARLPKIVQTFQKGSAPRFREEREDLSIFRL
jgi:hypothetical protein